MSQLAGREARRPATPGARRPGPALFVVTDQRRRGAQVFAAELARVLNERDHAVRMVALVPGETTGTPLAVPALGERRFGLATLRNLRAEVKRSGIAVGFGSSTLPALAAVTVGTDVPFIYRSIGELPFWAGRPDRRIRVRAELRRARYVVVLWQAAVGPITTQFGVPRERVRVIPRGVDTTRFPFADAAARAAARAELDLPADATIVAWVGALSPEKRPELAVHAVAKMPDDHVLVVAGDGPATADARALADEVAPGRVHFLGTVADTAPVYAAADVVALTSESEGMPGVLIEAGLSGRPAVTTAVGAASEVVLAGETGAVVPVATTPAELADNLLDVLADRDRLGRAAHERCKERYSLAGVADAWGQLLDEATA